MTKSKEVKDEESQVKMAELDLNVLIKFIGTFDGSRDTLIPFLNNCRNAINLASSSQQDILFKYILSRLTGKAESVCAIKDFTKWSQLEDFLKTQFGDRKHYAHLLADLQACKQSPTENVGQYSLRIETCLSNLLTEINISIPTKKKDELSGRVATMQDLALNRFMMGLDPRLATIVRCRDPSTLNEAINFASAEEKILGITYRANSFSSPYKINQPNSYRQNLNSSYPRPQGQTAHPRPQGQSYFARPQGQPGPSYSQAPVCRYCKNIGHTIENCRKREYNNRRSGNSPNQQTSMNRQFNQGRNQPIHMIDMPETQGFDEVDSQTLNAQAFPSSIVREL